MGEGRGVVSLSLILAVVYAPSICYPWGIVSVNVILHRARCRSICSRGGHLWPLFFLLHLDCITSQMIARTFDGVSVRVCVFRVCHKALLYTIGSSYRRISKRNIN